MHMQPSFGGPQYGSQPPQQYSQPPRVQPGEDSKVIYVPSRFVGGLIGKGGATMKVSMSITSDYFPL
jgi:hypothetical protein